MEELKNESERGCLGGKGPPDTRLARSERKAKANKKQKEKADVLRVLSTMHTES